MTEIPPTPPAHQPPLQLRRALKLAFSASPGWGLASAALTLVQGLLPLLSIYLMKLVLDATVEATRAKDRGAALQHVLVMVALAAGAAFLSVLLQGLMGLVNVTHAQIVGDRMQTLLHHRSVAVDLDYYEDPRYQDTLHRAQAEAPFRPLKILTGITGVFQSLLSISAMLGLLLVLHWAVPLIVVVATIPNLLVRLRHSRYLFSWQREMTPLQRAAAYFSRILTGREHAKEVRLFGLGARFIRRFDAVRTRLRTEQLQLARRRTLATALAQLFSLLAVFGCYGFVAASCVGGSITLGDLVMYSQAIQRGQGHVQQVFAGMAGLLEDRLFLANLFDFLDLPTRISSPAEPHDVPRKLQSGVAFEDVSFRYPTAHKDALCHVNLRILPGEHLALVGPNGAGKTTLVKLLCRLHDPCLGRITLDGIDLRQFDPSCLRQAMSVVFQDFARYDLTARENIELGDVTADQIPSQRVREAARRSGVLGLIQQLPEGFDTILGNWFRDGQQLSQGEWQKIALARAFLRRTPIMILDEPTAGLDPLAEAEVFGRFHDLMQGRMAVLVSHRLSTVKLAQRILVMQGGEIVEDGSHEELASGTGPYARLFTRRP